MKNSPTKSNRAGNKLGSETGVDDDLLSGVVGGAGAPTAAAVNKTTTPDHHLDAINHALAAVDVVATHATAPGAVHSTVMPLVP